MTRNVVNLDALLPREDLASEAESTADIPGLKLSDLEKGLIYSWLRKPDFQRETANWSPEQIADLIETFVKGNIIPSIILWQSGNRVFVIDGAHRLSALIAWVRDDYGAGKISAELYQNIIPEHQRTLHNMTRELVHGKIGSYEEHLAAAQFPGAAKPEVLKRATQFPFRSIDVQWIRNASVDQARDAFFRINQGGTEIEATETRILRAKSSPLALSSRAISRGGSGHNYWRKFDTQRQAEIQTLGAELQKLLFAPPLQQPVKTLDVPLAGFGYGSHVLPFAFDLVARTNRLTVADSTRRKTLEKESSASDDPDGLETLSCLTATRKTVRLICSNHPSSLGLHPALYFYTPDGAFHSAALFNAADWFTDLDSKGYLNDFLQLRERFESLILSHPVIVKPPSHKLGSGTRTKARTVALYERIFELMSKGASPEDVWSTIVEEPNFLFLKPADQDEKVKSLSGTPGRPFARGAKSAAFFSQAFPSAPKCSLCGGLLHVNGMVVDHKQVKTEGGSSASANARMVHPICNSNREAIGL